MRLAGRRAVSTAIVAAAFAAFPAAAGAVGTTYAVGDAPSSVALGDWTGDGIPDAGVANEGSTNVSILPGDGAGGFQILTVPIVRAVVSPPVAIAAGDLDRDGLTEFVTADPATDSVGIVSQTMFEGDYNAGDEVRGVAVGKVDGDRHRDIVVTGSDEDRVRVLFGNKDEDYTARERAKRVGDDPRGVAIADLDRDGQKDLLVANHADDDVTLLFGEGRGRFGDRKDLKAGGFPIDVTTGRFPGNKLVDPLVANESLNDATPAANFISFFNNKGDRKFGKQVKIGGRIRPVAVAAGDVNGDGGTDQVASYFVSGRIGFFYANGSTDYIAGDGPGSVTPTDVALANLDADKAKEIVNTDSTNDEINVFGGA